MLRLALKPFYDVLHSKGVWFVTQKRVRDLELRASDYDKKHEQIITEISSLKIEVNAEINNLKTEINDVKVKIARV